MPGAKRGNGAGYAWQRLSAIRTTDLKHWWRRRLPILEWAPRYSVKENLAADTVSGLMLAVHQVAQGLAFAIMSSVHPVFGLYGSLFPSFIYAVFGMGRHVVPGTFALTSLISAGAVERLVPPSNASSTPHPGSSVLGLSEFELQRIGVAAAVSFLGGVIQVAMFVLQLGNVTFIMSQPVISSMTTGAATHGLNAEVKYLLGLKMPFISGPLGMFYIYGYVFNNIHSVQLEAALLSALSIVLLLIVKKVNEKFRRRIKIIIPVDLILIAVLSLACYFADMENTYGLQVVGHIPKGLPSPRVPPLNILNDLIIEGFGIAFVGYAASIGLANSSDKNMKSSIDNNQELLAHGLSNVIPSFFHCIPSAAAMARTNVLKASGAKTQMACLISCAVMLLVIYVVAPLLYWLPMCVLASVVVVSLKGMLMQFCDLKKYWNTDKADCVIWICTYLVTICFAANIGLLFGIVFNVAVTVVRLTRAKTVNLKTLEEKDCKDAENTVCEPRKCPLRLDHPGHQQQPLAASSQAKAAQEVGVCLPRRGTSPPGHRQTFLPSGQTRPQGKHRPQVCILCHQEEPRTVPRQARLPMQRWVRVRMKVSYQSRPKQAQM
ncbi:anion exchange transporter [Ambystoma mexicanum]|uniref:anion exchange transporter n=1 Tax=Ambystoma mexicanum TaxID=8296 RepID=UPI0037E8BCE9